MNGSSPPTCGCFFVTNERIPENIIVLTVHSVSSGAIEVTDIKCRICSECQKNPDKNYRTKTTVLNENERNWRMNESKVNEEIPLELLPYEIAHT